jgi:amino acid transporter
LMRIPRVFVFIMKYIAPAYLLVVLIGFSYYNLPQKATELLHDPIALWTVAIIAGVIALLVVLVAIGERRWSAAGMDLDGKRGRGDL